MKSLPQYQTLPNNLNHSSLSLFTVFDLPLIEKRGTIDRVKTTFRGKPGCVTK